MKSKIIFLDFDGTLMDSPLDTHGKELWLKKTGSKYPYEGWWGKPESLSLDVFEIKPIASVLQRIQNLHESVMTVLLTARINKVEEAVHKVLAANNIKLDFVTFKVGAENKGERIQAFVEKYPEIREVEFYDDMTKHFDDAVFLKRMYPHVKFRFFLVENGRVSEV